MNKIDNRAYSILWFLFTIQQVVLELNCFEGLVAKGALFLKPK